MPMVNDPKLTEINHPQNKVFDKVSVVIVTYNAAKTLQNALDSIYRQKYPNIEIVIVDGKSTDDTVKILEANNEQIAYWKSEPDEGIYDAMNKSLKFLTGNWVYFLGADDTLLDDFSAFCYELKEHGAFYYGSVWSRGIKCSGLVSEYYQAKIGIYHQAIIYSADIFKKYQFDTRYRVSADYVLNMKCWKDKTIPFVFKDYVIADFNHTGVSSSGPDEVFFKEKSSLIRQNFGNRIWIRYLFRRLKEKLRGDK